MRMRNGQLRLRSLMACITTNLWWSITDLDGGRLGCHCCFATGSEWVVVGVVMIVRRTRGVVKRGRRLSGLTLKGRGSPRLVGSSVDDDDDAGSKERRVGRRPRFKHWMSPQRPRIKTQPRSSRSLASKALTDDQFRRAAAREERGRPSGALRCMQASSRQPQRTEGNHHRRPSPSSPQCHHAT